MEMKMAAARRESFRILACGLLAGLTTVIGIAGAVHGVHELQRKPMAAVWLVLGLAGIAICFIKLVQKKDNDDIVPKLFLTIFFFVSSFVWLVR